MSTYLQSAVGSRLFEHNDSTSSLSEHMFALCEALPDVPEHIVYSSPDGFVSQTAPASGSGTLLTCEESTRISRPQPLRNNTIRIKRNRSRSPSVCSALSQSDVTGSGSGSGSFLTWPSSSASFVPLRRCRSRASVVDPSSAVPAPSSNSSSALPTPTTALTLTVPPQTAPATLSPFPSSPRSLSHLRLPSDASAASASTTATSTSSSTFASKSTAPSSTSVSKTCAPTYTYPSCMKQSHSRLGVKPTATAAVMAHAMVGKTMRRSASISTKNSMAKSVRFAEIPIVHTDVVWASESESSDYEDEDDDEGRGKVSSILTGAEEEEEEGMEAVFGMHEGEELEIQEIVEEPLAMEHVEEQQVEEVVEHGKDEDDGTDHDRVTDANTHANARRSKPSTSLTQTARTVKKWLLRTVTKPVSSSLSSLSSSSSSSSAPQRPVISGPLPLGGSSALAAGAAEKRGSDTASLRSRSSSVASTSSRVSLPSSPRPLTIPASRTRLTLNLNIPGPYPLSTPSMYAHAHSRTRLESDVSLASTSASLPSSALAVSPRSPHPRRRGASFVVGKSPVSPMPKSPVRVGTVPMVRSGSRNRCMASFGPSSPQEEMGRVVVGGAGP